MYPSIERTSDSPKPALRTLTSSGTGPPWQLVVGIAQAAPGQHFAPLLDRQHELGSVRALERPDEAAVDRSHRRHVAGAETFELAHLDVLEADHVGGFLDRGVDLVGLAQVAGDRGAHVHVARADRLRAQHVV